MNRRDFLKSGAIMGLGATLQPINSLALGDNPIEITILHTNDVHSHLEAFPDDGSKYANRGGVVKRAYLIEEIRKTNKNVLLFDSGDIFQGTSYFNLFKGEPEIKAMTKMGYDAATMGNHDFDLGIEGFEKQLVHANFPILCANYDFNNTILDQKTTPYKIFHKEGIKIGVLGVGIALKGLVPDALYKETKYLDPIEMANHYAKILHKQEKCDLVICLSHLGYEYNGDKISDKVLAQNSEHIHIILGGHTHTFLKEPVLINNMHGNQVIINQVGWAGLYLGKISLFFNKNRTFSKPSSYVFSVK